MAINKIVLNTDHGEQVLVDLTGDTVAAEDLHEGVTAHDKSGERVVGTFTLAEEMATQDELIASIKTALQGKAAGGGGTAAPVIKTLEVTANGTYPAPGGVDGYSPVIVHTDAELTVGKILSGTWLNLKMCLLNF